MILIINTFPNMILGWRILPLIVHLPNFLLLFCYYHKRISTCLSSICTSYLLCQPPRWIYLILEQFINNIIIKLCLFIVLHIIAFLLGYYVSQPISKLYNKDNKSVYIFGSVPIVYYIVNYYLETYTNFWSNSNPIITEFFRFFLCIVFLLFSIVYYKEYESKADLELQEQFIKISFEQQKKELESIKEKENEIRIIRHDMRLFLNTLIMHINQDDKEAALNLATTLASNIEATNIRRYCDNDIVNYIVSDYAAKCEKSCVYFHTTIEIQELDIDEIIFSSILSNALDNALNATSKLSEKERNIKFLLKTTNGKLLLSIRNPFSGKIVFSDGLPVSKMSGHGYGTQSIRYMTKRLGGNCQFTIEENEFILRVVI